MLVAAGYYNYSTFNTKSVETYAEDIKPNNEQTNIGDAVLVSNNEEEPTNTNQPKTENQTQTNTNSNLETNNTSTENIFQDIQTSAKINETTEQQNPQNENQETNNEDSSNYYASSKLDRDKMYAEMISSYQEVLNNTNCSEAQKSIATQEIAKINNTKNAIMICENLILAKNEFQNCVILINETNVNVVVKIEGGLKTESVAKIQNIISREMGTEIENIHITEK